MEDAIIDVQPTDSSSNASVEPTPGSATFKASESLANWRETQNRGGEKIDDKTADVEDSETSNDPSQQEENSSSEKEDKKKDDSKQTDKEESKEDKEEDSHEEDDSKEDDSKEDDTHEEKEEQPDDDFSDENKDTKPSSEVDVLKEEIEKLKALMTQKEQMEKETQLQKEIEEAKKLVEEPFKFDFSVDDIKESLSPEALDFFYDDPEAFQHQSELVKQAINVFMDKFNKYNEAYEKVGQYEQIQQEKQKAEMLKQLEGRGIDHSVFKTDSFAKFESDPRNADLLNSFNDRFGFGTVEYIHHVYDAYQNSLKTSRKDRKNSLNEKASSKRDKISKMQNRNKDARVSGAPKVKNSSSDSFDAAAILAEYRKRRSS